MHHTHSIPSGGTGIGIVAGGTGISATANAAGGSETRPEAAVVLYCIRI